MQLSPINPILFSDLSRLKVGKCDFQSRRLCICNKCHSCLKNSFTGNTQKRLSQYNEDYLLMEQEVEDNCEQSIAK